jgi:hypothetical protein
MVCGAHPTKMDSRSFDSLDYARDKCAPYFALNGGASDFAKATPDKSQDKQDRLRGNDPRLRHSGAGILTIPTLPFTPLEIFASCYLFLCYTVSNGVHILLENFRYRD